MTVTREQIDATIWKTCEAMSRKLGAETGRVGVTFDALPEVVWAAIDALNGEALAALWVERAKSASELPERESMFWLWMDDGICVKCSRHRDGCFYDDQLSEFGWIESSNWRWLPMPPAPGGTNE